MFPYSALCFDRRYIFMSVHRGLVYGSELQKTAEIRSCSSSMVVDIPVVAQMHIPLVRIPSRFSSCSTLIRWSTFVVQVQQFSNAHVEETAELPQLHLVEFFGQGR